jgi:hypothetical protein
MPARKMGLINDTREFSRDFSTKRTIASLPAALKGCNVLIQVEIFFSVTNIGEGILSA